MSSLRNAVKRITHKERGQLQSRSHLGLLEKKKDYKKRAIEYHNKQDTINAAKQRVAMRNPDEYYFGMNNAEISNDGYHRKTQKARQKEFDTNIGHDTIRIMKDQDIKYIRIQKQKDIKKIERLQSTLHINNDNNMKPKNKHTIFVNTKKDAEEFNIAKHFNTLPELADRTFNRPRIETLKQTAVKQTIKDEKIALITKEEFDKMNKVARKVAKAKARANAELEARKKRIETLQNAESHLITEKLVASKGKKRKIKPAMNGKPAVYKWTYKRSR